MDSKFAGNDTALSYAACARTPKAALMFLFLLVLAPLSWAQGADGKWPTRPIRMVHGFISGGSVDITARLLAAQMTGMLGQQVIVDGRPGAGGTTGASIVAKSAPDGYTLFLMASGHATSPGLYRSLPYDPVKDFTMISMVASNPMVVVATPAFPPRTIQEVVQLARKEPGRINYGTGGVGTGMHLASVLFQARAGIKLNHIPYKGGTAGPTALLAGEIPLLFTTAAGVANHVETGRIRALAVTTSKRFVLWPNVPTIAETVLPNFDVLAWYAVAAPKNMPAPLVNRLNEVVREALKRNEVVEKLLTLGAETRATSPREAQQFLASEVARWTKVTRDENIPPQD
ncbi:MAG: tripartite tricarboxylate transporter substrate binding protein [Betaproteobacteria bacterium]|nr:tripartite tricarboxylate transporter substrate binding protein [Betaproteobacteria bacterium]